MNVQLHRRHAGGLGGYQVGDLPFTVRRCSFYSSPRQWQILAHIGVHPESIIWLNRHGLRLARFSSRGEAVRTLLASAAVDDPGRVVFPKPARQADGSYLTADKHWRLVRDDALWEILPASRTASQFSSLGAGRSLSDAVMEAALMSEELHKTPRL